MDTSKPLEMRQSGTGRNIIVHLFADLTLVGEVRHLGNYRRWSIRDVAGGDVSDTGLNTLADAKAAAQRLWSEGKFPTPEAALSARAERSRRIEIASRCSVHRTEIFGLLKRAHEALATFCPHSDVERLVAEMIKKIEAP